MKIDRLIGILSILLQKEMTTAPELAEHFEVSRRTINRDIEALCTAGLRSLDSVGGSRYYGQLMEKLQAGSSELVSGRDSMLIDLSSWYKTSLAPKIATIQSAIENRHLLRFHYYAPSGESERTVEPYYVVFQWTNWYVYGWCRTREDYRLFKLNRTDEVAETAEAFSCRNAPLPDLSAERVFPGRIRLKALFAPEVRWRLVEEYGPDCCAEGEDGRLVFEEDFTNEDQMVSWILAFGDKAEVLEPQEVREQIAKTAENMTKAYRRNER